MSHFKEIKTLNHYNLIEPYTSMINNNHISWSRGENQICINSVPGHDDIHYGVGSLVYNWDASYTVNNNGVTEVVVPEREEKINENDFTEICSVFKGTIFEDVYNELESQYHVGRVRLMKSLPKTCLSWHSDSSMRLHYPVSTQDGCFMLVEDEVKHLGQEQWWMVDTRANHTAMNASKKERIHLVAVILGEK